jgi:hypothetical protein
MCVLCVNASVLTPRIDPDQDWPPLLRGGMSQSVSIFTACCRSLWLLQFLRAIDFLVASVQAPGQVFFWLWPSACFCSPGLLFAPPGVGPGPHFLVTNMLIQVRHQGFVSISFFSSCFWSHLGCFPWVSPVCQFSWSQHWFGPHARNHWHAVPFLARGVRSSGCSSVAIWFLSCPVYSLVEIVLWVSYCAGLNLFFNISCYRNPN